MSQEVGLFEEFNMNCNNLELDDDTFFDCEDDTYYEDPEGYEDIDINMLRVSAAPGGQVGNGPQVDPLTIKGNDA